MRFRLFLCLALIASLNFSVCTGGVFSAASVLAAEFSEGLEPSEPMSKATIDSFLCRTAVFEDENDITASFDAGCDGDEVCIQQAGHSNIERSILAFGDATSVQDATSPCDVAIEIPSTLVHPTARAGPLYQSASLLAHSLIKLE